MIDGARQRGPHRSGFLACSGVRWITAEELENKRKPDTGRVIRYSAPEDGLEKQAQR
jgi:hypothetical protein